jgi:hypothetical protein
MNPEESLSLTPPQIKQNAQKTLENLLPEKSKSQNDSLTFCSLLFINLLCSLRDLFFDICQSTLHATNINTVNFTSLFYHANLLKHK